MVPRVFRCQHSGAVEMCRVHDSTETLLRHSSRVADGAERRSPLALRTIFRRIVVRRCGFGALSTRADLCWISPACRQECFECSATGCAAARERPLAAEMGTTRVASEGGGSGGGEGD